MTQPDDRSPPDSPRGGRDFARTGLSPAAAETLARIQDWLDRDPAMESPPPAPTGPEDRDWLTATSALQDGLRHAPRPSMPEIWPDAILGAVHADRRRGARLRLRYGVGAALAASLLCAVAVFATRSNRTDPDTDNGPAVAVAIPPQHDPAPANLHDSLVEARAAFVTLTKRTADETVDRTMSLLTVPDTKLMTPADPWEKTLDPAAESLDEARNGAASGFQPVASSARRAVDRFFREINPMAPQRPEPY